MRSPFLKLEFPFIIAKISVLSSKKMKFFRVHTADIAYITQQPRGIFTAIGKLVDAGILSEEETAEYWKNREYFEKVLHFRVGYGIIT